MAIEITEVLETGDVQVRSCYSEIGRSDIDLSTTVCGYRLRKGCLGAPMDTVVGDKLAEEMFHYGGLGVLDRSRSIDERAQWVQYLKSKGVTPIAAAFGSMELAGNPGALDPIVDAGVHILSLDASNSGCRWDFNGFRSVLRRYPKIRGINGNFLYPEEVKPYLELLTEEFYDRDVDLKNGRATGGGCTTSDTTGGGGPLWGTAAMLSEYIEAKFPKFRGGLIVDGGLSTGGDLAKLSALKRVRAGMFGRVAAAIRSSLAPYADEEQTLKWYRGMASQGAREDAARRRADIVDRYKTGLFQGTEGLVPVKEDCAHAFDPIFEGLADTMISCNCATLEEFNNYQRFIRVTAAGREKLSPHSLIQPTKDTKPFGECTAR